jgi:hypothetical protein
MKLLNIFNKKPVALRDTKEWQVLFNELVDLQNSGHHEHQDILTITGFMKTLDELEAHVKRNRR